MGMSWTGVLNEEGVRPGTAASGLAAPSSLSALSGEEPRREATRGYQPSPRLASGPSNPGPSSPLSALAATAPIPLDDGRPFLGSGRAQLAVFAAVMLGGPLGFTLTVITKATL